MPCNRCEEYNLEKKHTKNFNLLLPCLTQIEFLKPCFVTEVIIIITKIKKSNYNLLLLYGTKVKFLKSYLVIEVLVIIPTLNYYYSVWLWSNSESRTVCKCNRISYYVTSGDPYFPHAGRFYREVSRYFDVKFDCFAGFFIQIVAMDIVKGKLYQSLYRRSVLK